jgi:glycosyltransferase involved in cell wall biosynthesis
VSREVYGDAAVYVERPEPSAIAGALERALFDERERQRVLRDGAGVVKRYSWDAAARQLLSVLEAAHG